MENINKLLKQQSNLILKIENITDADDGSVSLDGFVIDANTDRVIAQVIWEYDFSELVTKLDKEAKKLLWTR